MPPTSFPESPRWVTKLLPSPASSPRISRGTSWASTPRGPPCGTTSAVSSHAFGCRATRGDTMEGYRFVQPIEVRFRDVDAVGHVNNAVYLTYIESARVAWWIQTTGRPSF